MTTAPIGAVVISREDVTRAQLHAATGARDFDPAAERQVDRAIGKIREALDGALRIRWEHVGYVLEVSP